MIPTESSTRITVRCKSGMDGWQDRLHAIYHSEEIFKQYAEQYGLHRKLGFQTPYACWLANPLVQGSTIPEDYCMVLSPNLLPMYVKVVVELKIDTDDEPVPAWQIREGAEEAIENIVKLGVGNGFDHEHADVLSIGLVSVDVENDDKQEKIKELEKEIEGLQEEIAGDRGRGYLI